ncbi:hypothetical protein GPDM_02435 [Planococcus donghaensis MPA1U2]|uniref:DUF3221 domain-containing protein n=1 Tax=Planococcus donghaensis MPA1U2 TaxID=933115 RepID=E7RDF9_9BACL|nr:hypothetical protein [Planococcus donghaensis]EGA90963.1 hypothetical protein GPDM_02435 [Planococcus donghaensis MPA1U2]
MKFLKYLLLFAFILLLASCSTGYPATELEGEEPIVIGHIIEVLEEKIIFVVEGMYKKGDKVAVWKFEEGPEIAEKIVLLEK